MNSTSIKTVGGRVIDFNDPDPTQIALSDIAHGLSMICRYVGQLDQFYSVCKHSLLVEWFLRQQGQDLYTRLRGLMHDAHEAYTGDLPRPLKTLLSLREEDEIKIIANRLDCMIARALGYAGVWRPESVTAADRLALGTELYMLRGEKYDHLPVFSPLTDIPTWLQPTTREEPGEMAKMFGAVYGSLIGEIKVRTPHQLCV